MSVFIKNISGTTQIFRTKTVLAGQYAEIPEFERPLWAADSNLLNLVTTDVAQIARDASGTKDITDKAEQWRYLSNLVPLDVHIGKGVPRISSKLRYECSTVSQDISSNSVYTVLYNYSGSGCLYGILAEFNSDNIDIQLKIDGEIIFSLQLEDTQSHFKDEGNSAFNQGSLSLIFGKDDTISYKPRYPIEFQTSVEFSAKLKTGYNSTKRCDAYAVELTKET